MQKLKAAYVLWHDYHCLLPKTHRHSVGTRIDTLFIETIEAVAAASFLKPAAKQPYIHRAIQKTDALNVLLLILWETKSLDNNKYLALSEKTAEIGRMLGGWHGQLTRTLQKNPHQENSLR